jgi:hypothetical protein
MYKCKDNLIIREIDSKYIIINMDTGEITTFEGTGNAFFKALLELKDKNKAYEYLLNKYDVKSNELKCDIEKFISELERKNIIILEER